MVGDKNVPTRTKRYRINIVVGGRFQSGLLYEALKNLGHDVRIYASSPPQFFPEIPFGRITFIPKLSQLVQKGLGVKSPRWLTYLSSVIFDYLVSIVMRDADLIWGFNGDSYLSGSALKRRGGKYIVDRACPHVKTQVELLSLESKKNNYPYEPLPRGLIKRFTLEYEIADAIVVPSNYSARSFYLRGFDGDKILKAPLDANARETDSSGVRLKELDGVEQGVFVVGIVGGSF